MLENQHIDDEEIKECVKQKDYGTAAKLLLKQQKETWAQITEGYSWLETVETKIFRFEGFEIKIQFNPGRLKSSSAKVDAKSIKERKCFLCPENLPELQKGIEYKDGYIILVNPFPIFPEHFTLPHVEHKAQNIKNSFSTLLSLSKDLSKYYSVFYNGPFCGASAPDHMHFQAGTKFFMPIENDFHQLKNEYGEIIYDQNDLIITGIDDGLRKFISFEGTDDKILINVFEDFYKHYNAISKDGREPMMNILSFYEEEFGWRVLIFVREKHRSSHYFAEGENNILLSPASVDLGGVCITPLEKDFNKITKENIIEIFQEIGIGKEHFDYLKESFKK